MSQSSQQEVEEVEAPPGWSDQPRRDTLNFQKHPETAGSASQRVFCRCIIYASLTFSLLLFPQHLEVERLLAVPAAGIKPSC